jgi:hypothetical protein
VVEVVVDAAFDEVTQRALLGVELDAHDGIDLVPMAVLQTWVGEYFYCPLMRTHLLNILLEL